MRRELERVEIPDEHEARVRAWEVVRAAFDEREPAPRRRRAWKPALVLSLAAAVTAAALSGPGRAVIDEVREAIAVERVTPTQPALVSLPASGRVLVAGGGGAWIVHHDGSKRRLGAYDEATWSPRGLFVAAVRGRELFALDPKGNVRWSLARARGIQSPAWAPSGFRIAYRTGDSLRVVAGDGTGDRVLAPAVQKGTPLAWRPGDRHVLAYADARGIVRVVDADTRRVLWSGGALTGPTQLAWSRDGARLLVATTRAVAVYGSDGRLRGSRRLREVVDGAAFGLEHTFALVQHRGRGETAVVSLLDADRLGAGPRRVFTGSGFVDGLAWSPDGRWLLLSWPTADEWIFVRAEGRRRLAAVAGIRRQLGGGVRFPSLRGWCCAAAVDVEPVAVRVPAPAPPVRPSLSLGLPWAGRLVRGVRLPAEGPTFFTWDPVRRRSPNRDWRRHGGDRLVRLVVRVLGEFRAAHPDAPRIGVGDVSRPGGGDFGPRYGLPGHVSHQNGLDVDLYYPRLDRRERPPAVPRQIDRRLAQDLVDRFVRAGAIRVFVGPRTGLRGPRNVVQALTHHDNHMHVRLGRVDRELLGRSVQRRAIHVYRFGDPAAQLRVLVVGCVHGNECAGTAVTRRLIAAARPRNGALWIVPNLNPDGLAGGRRQNARGVDLNRNFGAGWRAGGKPWDVEYPGPRPWSEPESRLARDLVLRFRPTTTVWFHQAQDLVRATGTSVATARRYARLTSMRFRLLPQPAGAATRWQTRRLPGTSAFVVELPAGRLPAPAARRHAQAVLRLAG